VNEAPSRLAVAARYVFSPAILDCLEETRPGKGGEIQLTDAIRLLIQRGGRVLGVRLPEGQQRFDIGNFESYFQAFVDFALGDPLHGPGLREHLRKLLAERSH
jgi:UTP--glucose-1-phosphate uridylyltransferase